MTEAFENMLEKVGLTTPFARGVVVGAATVGLLWLIKPGSMFMDDGEAKAFSLMAPEGTPAAETTSMPWWAVSAGAGIAFALFI